MSSQHAWNASVIFSSFQGRKNYCSIHTKKFFRIKVRFFFFKIKIKFQNPIVTIRMVLMQHSIHSSRHCTKGQLISECLFGVFNFPNKQCKNLMNFCPRISKSGQIRQLRVLFHTNHLKQPLISNNELVITIKCLYLFDSTTFQILGQKFIKFLHGLFGKLKTAKKHSEIN